MELGHLDKESVKNTRRRGSAGKHCGVFSLKTTFWIKNFTQRWTQLGSFFQKSGRLFQSSKGQGRPPPSYSHVSGWISINIPEYPWISLKMLGFWLLGLWICMIILHVRHTFEDARVSICLIMAPYASIMPEHGWILLNVPEYAWKCVNKLSWLCQGSQYAVL